ncbi:MAG: hypothetical protein NC223_04295 [Butyrivibrio sp.]|nr:hypothetical protein [Butyrivibrio sp.]
MKKFISLSTAILISALASILTAGCGGGRITLSETFPAPAATQGKIAEASSEDAGNTESGELTSASSADETAAPTEFLTETEAAAPSQTDAETMTEARTEPAVEAPPETLPPQPSDAEPKTEAPKPLTPEPPQTGGFVGTSQQSYNPYGCDAQRANELAERIESGNLSTQGLFKNTLLVGDSIMTGFADYKLANQGNVIASVGAMLKPHLANNMQTIIDYNPEVLIIHYGLNEMGVEDYHVNGFIKELRAELELLQRELPYTKIVVMSLWPVKDAAAAKQPRLANLPNYNTEIRKLCVELGVAYDERSELIISHPDWYQNDGIHCVKKMYLEWIKAFVKEMGLY